MDNKDNNEAIKPLKFEPISENAPRKSIQVRKKTVFVGISLFLCLAAAIFLFTARAVYVESTPANANLEISALLKLKLADRYLLVSGDYPLSLKAEGYYDLEQTLTVDKQASQRFAFEMQRLPGHLQVTSGVGIDAKIMLDGELMGRTPALIRDIPPGEHQLALVADRYFPLQETIEIEGLDKEQRFEAVLTPAWAEVTLSSEPSGADIIIDEEVRGQTPSTVEILEGKHEVRVKLAGYKPWKEKLNVIANQPLDFSSIELELADATIFLASDPPRANATVDGEYKGLTPIELAMTPGKTSTVKLFKQGYQSASRKIQVASGEEKRVLVKLSPELVDVEFNITPKDARLLINGKAQSKANLTLELAAKKHRVEVRKEGYVTYQTSITPHTGIAQQVNVNLKTERQAQIEKIKPVYTTSAGQTLKLFYPSSFTMGASRREPGRRANETLRNIDLKRPFYLGIHEVTNAQYRKFKKEHNSGVIQGKSLDGDNQPVTKLNWEQAAAYCNWLSASESLTPFYTTTNNKIRGVNQAANSYRLPTEAEWAWAARKQADNSLLKFPWGGKMPPPDKSGNYADNSTSGFLGKVLNGYNDGYLATAPVGSFSANGKGLFDMGGNVAEWIHDYYDIQLGSNGKAELDPLGPETGKFHVIRGSSWAHGTLTELRLSYRDYNAKERDDVGFRIARYLE
ncbi:MAG: PEGA domain-containing protein [Gammaproteobacteria bacterium]|nr:PEGA domain-containing protein [Gammaproteobacteria bacterium]